MGASLLVLAKSMLHQVYYLRACFHGGVQLQVGDEIRLSM